MKTESDSYLLTGISLEGFRLFKNAQTELEPLTVFVGKNGCGKSSILKALLLIPTAASYENLRMAMEQIGGGSGIFHKDANRSKITLATKAFSKETKKTYHIEHHATLLKSKKSIHNIIFDYDKD